MLTATLRTVGGSVMMAIPKSVLEGLGIAANAKVNLSLDDGCLIVKPRSKPKYTLSELINQCDQSAPASDETSRWPELDATGHEAW